MTAPTQDTFDEVLGAVADDWRPSREESREAIRKAVHAAAAANGQRVTAATIRPHLPPWVATEQIGAVMWRLQSRGYLTRTTRYAPNGKGGKARNSAKRSPVYRLERPIDPAGVQP